MRCKNCGHTPAQHEFDVERLRLARCTHWIDDDTDKGRVLCGCEGWR